MNLHHLIGALALALLLSACGSKQSADEHGHADVSHEEGAGHADGEEVRKGEHGGRWLELDGHAVELAINEDGSPPRYQAWLYKEGKPLPASEGSVEVRLQRLGNVAETHKLVAQADGSLIVRFHAAGWLEMAWHLYQWGDKVEVIAPQALSDLVERHRRSDFAAMP